MTNSRTIYTTRFSFSRVREKIAKKQLTPSSIKEFDILANEVNASLEAITKELNCTTYGSKEAYLLYKKLFSILDGISDTSLIYLAINYDMSDILLTYIFEERAPFVFFLIPSIIRNGIKAQLSQYTKK